MILADLLSTALIATTTAPAHGADVVTAPTDIVDYTISLGNLLTMGSFLVFVTVYVVNSRGAAKVLAARLQNVDSAMGEFKAELKKLGEVLIGQAQQDGRINLLEQRLLQEGNRVDDLGKNLGDFKNMVLQDTLKRPGQ